MSDDDAFNPKVFPALLSSKTVVVSWVIFTSRIRDPRLSPLFVYLFVCTGPPERSYM